MSLEDPVGAAQVVGFPEIGRREKLQVEPGPADEFLRERALEVDGHGQGLAVGLDPDAIGDVFLLEAERHFGAVGRPVDGALADGRELSPLARRRLEPDVAERRDPFAVLDDLEAALFALGVGVVEDEDRYAGTLEVLFGVEGPR